MEDVRRYIKLVIIPGVIVFVAAVGFSLFYHHAYTKPTDQIVFGRINLIEEAIDKNNVKQHKINHALDRRMDEIEFDSHKHDLLLAGVIEDLRNRTSTLDRRHLEVIRALAILQKKHWDPEKAAIASGFKVYGKIPTSDAQKQIEEVDRYNKGE